MKVGQSTAKNFRSSGDRTEIGGDLDIVEGGRLLLNGDPVVLEGTGTVPNGTVTKTKLATALASEFDGKLTATQAAAVEDSTAEDVPGLVADFNTLLASLRTAGIIAESE
jgi:hypothetical protein